MELTKQQIGLCATLVRDILQQPESIGVTRGLFPLNENPEPVVVLMAGFAHDTGHGYPGGYPVGLIVTGDLSNRLNIDVTSTVTSALSGAPISRVDFPPSEPLKLEEVTLEEGEELHLFMHHAQHGLWGVAIRPARLYVGLWEAFDVAVLGSMATYRDRAGYAFNPYVCLLTDELRLRLERGEYEALIPGFDHTEEPELDAESH